MKKILIPIIIIIIAGLVIWRLNSPAGGLLGGGNENASSTESVPTSQTTLVSTKISEYVNGELGFSVKYPTVWEIGESPANVTFIIPKGDGKEKNTIGNLEAKIDVVSAKCAFPPVTTVSERDTVMVGDLPFNMISIANTIQGRNYFSRLFSLQKGSICYYFTFSSIALSPSSQGIPAADAQKVGATNKSIIDAADTQFKDMVKSFKFVEGPEGQDETQVSPKK
jgi:hypothetical protein